VTDIKTVAETHSTNDDVAAHAREGAPEGLWLRAERQTGGRGRQGRGWHSPEGNLYASTLVRMREGDPPAPTLALVAAVALHEVSALFAGDQPSPLWGGQGGGRPASAGRKESLSASHAARAPHPTLPHKGGGLLSSPGASPAHAVMIKWPNDILAGPAKLAGILLERSGDAVVIGFGVNLAHHPEHLGRPVTSLAALIGAAPDPALFLETLAECFARWLARWRSEGLAPIRAAWLAAAHPPGTALATSEGEGLFDGLDPSGALRLRLADGIVRVIHAGDVFLL
jgi:BirA family transcriptional regulator, biotin operon repressor / biotin---[acetyl-CoA-carboxylase] ligase